MKGDKIERHRDRHSNDTVTLRIHVIALTVVHVADVLTVVHTATDVLSVVHAVAEVLTVHLTANVGPGHYCTHGQNAARIWLRENLRLFLAIVALMGKTQNACGSMTSKTTAIAEHANRDLVLGKDSSSQTSISTRSNKSL